MRVSPEFGHFFPFSSTFVYTHHTFDMPLGSRLEYLSILFLFATVGPHVKRTEFTCIHCHLCNGAAFVFINLHH